MENLEKQMCFDFYNQSSNTSIIKKDTNPEHTDSGLDDETILDRCFNVSEAPKNYPDNNGTLKIIME